MAEVFVLLIVGTSPAREHWAGPVCGYVDYTVEWSPHTETIQVVLDKKLLQAADRAARHMKQNRSALIRDALREHIRLLATRALEGRDREGYLKQPRGRDESLAWEAEGVWPEE